MTDCTPKDISNLSIPADTYEVLVESDSLLARVAEQLPAHVVDTGEAPDTNQDETTTPPTVFHDHATQD